ncbi:ankyrin repeat-containing domain protein, partial [Leptodontidium sp. 2 PMI_412]
GADVNRPSSNGWTPLHYAASIGSDSHVEILLNLGAQVNVCAGLHWTPLMVAVYNKYSETAKILIAHGADLEAKSADGETVLQI